jgi:UDP-glucose 4-epimerase
MGERVLVTGGAGYIGSITVRHLLDEGHEVVVIDDLLRGHRGAVDERAELVVADIGDRHTLDRVVCSVDSVVHCAGLIDVAESVVDPGAYFEMNVARPLQLLRAMVRHRVQRLVFSSTAAVYGVPDVSPIPEDAPTRPVNPHGESKLMFERAASCFAEAHGLRIAPLRYFNVAGAWPDGSLGEAHEPETHLIPRILCAMREGSAVVTINGDDYPTADGTCVRDYLHVLDLARAHALALAYLADGGASTTVNLGGGDGHSNLAVVRACERVTGSRVDLAIGPRRAGDPPSLVASRQRAEMVLGWRPERGDIETIVADAWRWHTGQGRQAVDD